MKLLWTPSLGHMSMAGLGGGRVQFLSYIQSREHSVVATSAPATWHTGPWRSHSAATCLLSVGPGHLLPAECPANKSDSLVLCVCGLHPHTHWGQDQTATGGGRNGADKRKVMKWLGNVWTMSVTPLWDRLWGYWVLKSSKNNEATFSLDLDYLMWANTSP